MTKTVYFKTFGCKVNQYETQGMRELLVRRGFCELDHPDDADYVIVNSCTVTRESDRKTLYYMRRLKKKNPRTTVVVAGCITEKNDHARLRDAGADCIVTNTEKKALDAKLGVAGDVGVLEQHDFSITEFKGHSRAFVKIQDGCSLNCSYCKVRLVRGPSRSRPLDDIVREVQALVRHGYHEVVVTGIHLGAYGSDLRPRMTLPQVLEILCGIRGLERIRLSSIEVNEVSPELISCMRTLPHLCPHLHIPLQSGDDAVLRRMRRSYTADGYREKIELVRREIPGCGLTTDVMVGFPGEDDAAFQRTVDLVTAVQPFKIHLFPFSPREGTDAAVFPGRISSTLMHAREHVMLQLNERLFVQTGEPLVGTEQEVFYEREGNDPRVIASGIRGRLRDWRPVIVEQAQPKNCYKGMMRICRVMNDHLRGTLQEL